LGFSDVYIDKVKRTILGAVVGLMAIVFVAPAAYAATSYPNDYFFATGKQWALEGAPASINAPQAWCVSTGAGVIIGHVDTGADFTHPDLAAKLIPGAAFVNGNGTMSGQGQAATQDDNGHGTLTAGLMVGATNNRTGVAAVAPDARALVVKVLNHDGKGYSIDVAAGVRWAVDNGAQVINLSIGSDTPLIGETPSHIPEAIDYATQHAVAVSIAAGSASLPFNEVQIDQIKGQGLVVNALAPDGSVSYYSLNPKGVNIYAPGGDDTQGNDIDHLVISTHWSKHNPGAYAFGEGASFASPQVAGVLALLMAKGYQAPQARERILATAPIRNGVPQLDAAKALDAGSLCGARVAAPIAAAGQPRNTSTYRPPAPPKQPPDSAPAAASSPTVIGSAGSQAESPPDQDRPIALTLGPWVWVVVAAIIPIGPMKLIGRKRRLATTARATQTPGLAGRDAEPEGQGSIDLD
jgi:serine protease